MATDTTVNNLIINKLTKAQYGAIASPSDTELYLVPDEIDNVPTSGSDNPVKSGGVYTALAGKADSADIPTVIDSLSSASTTSALSANQGKALNESKQDKIDSTHKLSADLVDDASTTNKFVTASDKSTWTGKQDALVSGTNIKTINGNSVLGNGNLSTLTPVVNHGTSDTTYTLPPNELHIWGTISALTISLGTPTDNTIVNEYMIQFESGSTATTLSLPSSVEWAESCGALSVEASKTYQISIVNNIGIWIAV